jgi:hypothetical protein
MIDESEIKVTPLVDPSTTNEAIQESIETTEPSVAFLEDWFELSTLDRKCVENNDRIRYIYDFIKSTGIKEPIGVFQYLRDVSYKLGAPRLGMSKLQHIYQYVKLQNQRQVLDLKEKELSNEYRPEQI